ncbi:MAG: protein kinase [Planctomycetota bacterium]
MATDNGNNLNSEQTTGRPSAQAESGAAEKTGISGSGADSGSVHNQPSRTRKRNRRKTAAGKSNRYQTTGQLGRGGWGVVESALDRQLKRPVAIKRIASDGHIPAPLKQRFLYEARITSQLQHPGIVPVHELEEGGSHGDTFYVMKLLSGDTFRRSIRETHREFEASTRKSSYKLREMLLPLLERFVDICDAVGYAHQQGVLHRDLKPDNVMVGEFGETMVVDWGLAKRFNEQSEPDDETTINQRLESTGALLGDAVSLTDRTVAGSVIGTPAYMPPEQAEGEIEKFSPASDIFSLGATLYEIVAGNHPHADAESGTVLERARKGMRTVARSVRPEVPRALCAICEKAMEFEPAERYCTATALADDVRKFISGEPVSVLKENFVEKAVRWCRRNKAIAFSSAIATIFVMLAALTAALLINEAHKAELAAHQQTQQAYSETLRRLEQSRRAADQWLIELSGSLQFYPGLAPVRQELLSQATNHYEELLDCELSTGSMNIQPVANFENSHAHHLYLERAKVLLRLGDLHRLQGATDTALIRYDSAAGILATLRNQISTDGDNLLYTDVRLQSVNVVVGQILSGIHSSDEFLRWSQWFDTELASRGIVADRHDAQLPELTAIDYDLVSARSRLSIACSRHTTTSGNAALSESETSVAWARWLCEVRGSAQDRSLLETALSGLAEHHEQAERNENASTVWQELIEHLENVHIDSPERIDFLQSLAFARLKLGNSLSISSKPEDIEQARIHFETSISEFRSAWQLSDADGFYQDNLASAENNLGLLLASEESSRAEAGRHLQNSIDMRKSLIQQQPSVHDVGLYCHTVARLAELQEGAQQLSLLNDADTGFQLVRDHGRLSTDDRTTWSHVLEMRALLHEASGDSEAAAVDRAIAERLQAGN